MDNDKNFDRLREINRETAKRQDAVFDRIQQIVKKNPDVAEQYLNTLTRASNWELYSRIYGKFAYITLVVLFLVAGLIFGIKKVSGANETEIIEGFKQLKTELEICDSEGKCYKILCANPQTNGKEVLGAISNLSPGNKLNLIKDNNTENVFQVKKNDLMVGNLSLSAKDIFVKFDGKPYKVGTERAFDNCKDFLFKIEGSYEYVLPEEENDNEEADKKRMYMVSFAEKNNRGVVWNKNAMEILKSDDARGNLRESGTQIYFLSHNNWNHSYILEMAIGKLGDDNIVYYLNGHAYVIGLK